MIGGLEEMTLEETDEYVIRRDRMGRRMKLIKGSATIPLPLDYPVADMASWQRIKPMFEFSEERFADGWAEAARAARDDGALIVARIPGGYDLPRQLMGDAAACMAYYTQPELMRDILDTARRTSVRVLERVVEQVTVDQLSVHEDMAGKSGPLAGPQEVEQFIAPYYRACWDVVESAGGTLFAQDSDGDMRPVIDAFMACGVNSMHPFEPAAGMDMVKTRDEHGCDLAIRGGIDKHVLRRSKEDIRAELEYKLQPRMRQGGVVFGLDHRIPNGTPIENYRYYVRTARELLGLDPDPAPGWARMAF
jgi:uroporphyrinogen-III decarboxylase